MGTSNPTFSTPPPSSSFSAASRSSIVSSSSVKQKLVFLYEWWLEIAHPTSDGRCLSIGGCTERLGTKIFHSAAVLKRHDTVTLGTADGILIKLCGAINKSRTHENGFPRQVCHHFLYGFPYDWEEFANQSFTEEPTDKTIPRGFDLDGGGASSIDGLKSFSPKSFDDLPVAVLRDLSDSSVEYSATCELWKSMFKDISQKYGGSAKDQLMAENSSEEENPSKQKNSTVGQNNKGEDDICIRKGRTIEVQAITEDSSKEETPSIQKNTTAEQNNTDKGDMSIRKGKRKNLQKVTLDKGTLSDSNVVRKGPCTRSATQLRNSRNKQEESISEMHAGKTVFDATEVTRKLKLRNRFVEVHVKHIA